MLLLRFKLYLSYLLSKESNVYSKKMELNNRKKIIIALAANYGNLGDVAITYSQKSFLEQSFPDRDVIFFLISDTFKFMKSLKKMINQNDIITIVGGGNIGNLYDDIEYCRQFIIKKFPKNKIIVFPQSIYFTSDLSGKISKVMLKHVYNKHNKLHVFLRERKSWNKYAYLFKKNLYIAPDIVFSNKNYIEPTYKRENILVCFRKDKEDWIDKKIKDKLLDEINRNYQNDKVIYSDTHVGDENNINILYYKLNDFINEIKKSKVVITDRLHGMILCYITKTPCIVLSGKNDKIIGSYEWIKDSNFIKIINGVENDIVDKVLLLIKEMSLMEKLNINYINLDNKFNILQEVINKDCI